MQLRKRLSNRKAVVMEDLGKMGLEKLRIVSGLQWET